jgi:parallel beta-helix repeat protein
MRWVVPVLLLSACGSDGDGRACTTHVGPSSSDDENVQTALIGAQSGDTVCLDEGTYSFRGELSLSVAGVTILGAGKTKTILDFANQDSGANGLSVTADDFLLQDLWIKNTPGDGVRVQNADGVTFRGVKVTWDAGSVTTNGAYAIYPVTCSNVVVEACEVAGASDAGIYVGQSMNVVVRDNDVYGNVAGIEIENTTTAEVVGNHAHGNTAGILAFNLPELPVEDGRKTRIHDNDIDANNLENFAQTGNIVSYVPAGTGALILATDEIEIDHNEIHGNSSSGVVVISFQSVMMTYDDPNYDPFSETIWIHDNTFAENGASPQGLLLLAGQPTLEDILWDGWTDAAKDNTDGHLDVCLSGNGSATFRNVNTVEDYMNQSTDMAPHDCTHPALGIGP